MLRYNVQLWGYGISKKDKRPANKIRTTEFGDYHLRGELIWFTTKAIGTTNKWNSKFRLQTLRFLEESPCKTQTKENVLGFLNAVKPFKLTKAECVMLVNDPPTTPLHIQLQIEDSEERLTEDAVSQIIEMSKEWLIPQWKQSTMSSNYSNLSLLSSSVYFLLWKLIFLHINDTMSVNKNEFQSSWCKSLSLDGNWIIMIAFGRPNHRWNLHRFQAIFPE